MSRPDDEGQSSGAEADRWRMVTEREHGQRRMEGGEKESQEEERGVCEGPTNRVLLRPHMNREWREM